MSIVFIISAPSGSGKSTLVGCLRSRVPNLLFSVSYTTRAPRVSEREGESYHFIGRDEFEACIRRNEFLEHAEVFGNYYGTHRRFLDRAEAEGSDLLLDIDVQGARQLKERVPDAVAIFVLPPSRTELERRLRARSEDSETVIQRRLHDATRELEVFQEAVNSLQALEGSGGRSAESGLYDYVIINDRVEESSEILTAIVRAERARRSRMEGRLRPILETFQQ
ncbi:MAG: guanylate kinase [Bryobacterales bacterium]|nr:guanylate kinase [Bryobacterales bacterium]